MEPRIALIDATLGAVVTDLDLSRMDAHTWKTVEHAFHEYAVLVFPGQSLSEQAQVAFANRFGEIELLAPDAEQKPPSNLRDRLLEQFEPFAAELLTEEDRKACEIGTWSAETGN